MLLYTLRLMYLFKLVFSFSLDIYPGWELLGHQFSSVQSLSCVQLFATPWTAAHQASLSITNSRISPKLMSIESVMPSSHLILSRPLLLLPPIPRSIRVFSNESNEVAKGLISFRMDWLDLLAVQGTHTVVLFLVKSIFHSLEDAMITVSQILE